MSVATEYQAAYAMVSEIDSVAAAFLHVQRIS